MTSDVLLSVSIFIVMLSVIMPNAIMLNATMLSVIMPNVVLLRASAPFNSYPIQLKTHFREIVQPGPTSYNFLRRQFTNVHNKLECLSKSSLPF
jgi:hypothetical protein